MSGPVCSELVNRTSKSPCKIHVVGSAPGRIRTYLFNHLYALVCCSFDYQAEEDGGLVALEASYVVRVTDLRPLLSRLLFTCGADAPR
jgi:hypothetical protein